MSINVQLSFVMDRGTFAPTIISQIDGEIIVYFPQKILKIDGDW